ncbi:hypothetical protein Naga_100006g31 [Nannochloropsis gaditana]|uniref:PD-(D/E)XK endonuclease-like domain-containing protein n=1 Tax=Nannochloropsis gaditana TaxID=72520 RepID=W7TQW9_9STRA|nr:hypothetical protein Naga_100006g31 [Nannochloropsis gaditana]
MSRRPAALITPPSASSGHILPHIYHPCPWRRVRMLSTRRAGLGGLSTMFLFNTVRAFLALPSSICPPTSQPYIPSIRSRSMGSAIVSMPRPTSTPSSTPAHTIKMATSSPSTPNPAPPAGIQATTRPRSDTIDPSAYIAPSVGLPTTVSPSSLGDFKTCPRLYRFRHLEKIPEPPSEVMVRGSMVHDALDELFSQPPEKRSKEVLHDIFRAVWLKRRDKYLELFPSTEDQRAFGMAGLKLLSNYLKVETPAEQEPLMREFRMRVPFPDGPSVTGILDRVDVEPGSGEWVVVDYKTGKAPALKYSDAVNERIMNDKFFQLKVYALLLEQVKQRTPTRLKLIYLGPSPPQLSPSPSLHFPRLVPISFLRGFYRVFVSSGCLEGQGRRYVPPSCSEICRRPLPLLPPSLLSLFSCRRSDGHVHAPATGRLGRNKNRASRPVGTHRRRVESGFLPRHPREAL